ncbi:hypothetical protein ACGFZB_35505 [Streptomyces cinerochromogenes]|uniref:Aminoglycoside phosphotransferase domain-containing protein n=1 Tax=Streptomyces cinerochromogenes TaxID=66422 RepID=A0ABW7BEN7_9ACTN
MSSTAGPGIQYALDAIAAGNAETLDGRSVNSAYRITDGIQSLSVKVHSEELSTELDFHRILRVDAALRGATWYPPLLDLGFHPAHRRLVAIRPYVRGVPSDDARKHIPELIEVLADLAALGGNTGVAADLASDYASPWLLDWEKEHRLSSGLLKGEWSFLARMVNGQVEALRDSAVRLTRTDSPAVYHSDLHGRNLIVQHLQPLTVIDWDEAGFTLRPADEGKSLWLSCRSGRGDFVLDPVAVRRFLARSQARLHIPLSGAVDLAKLGAMWFLPRYGHVDLLRQRDARLVQWYLGWVSRFWKRFRENVELIASTAASLDRDTPH